MGSSTFLRSVMLLLLAATGVRAHAADCDDDAGCPPVRGSVSLQTDGWRNVHGGNSVGDAGLFNVLASVDFDASAWGFKGLTSRVSGLYNGGGSIVDFTGAGQGNSNIETSRVRRMYEAWVQYQVGETPFSVLSGLYDLNSEFDAVEPAALFLNPSHGINPVLGQAGANGPSIFPAPGLAVRAQWSTEHFTVRTAAIDPEPGPTAPSFRWRLGQSALWVSEAAFDVLDTKWFAGAWRFTRGVPLPPEGEQTGTNAGVYFAAWRESETRLGKIAYFLRGSSASTQSSRFDRYAGAGVTATGWWRERPDDQLGFAIAHARSAGWLAPTQGDWETTFEVTWRASLNETFAVQPDVQYISNPAESDAASALAIGVRMTASFR